MLKNIDSRWECQLHRPLHPTSQYLNPLYYYRDLTVEGNAELVDRIHSCMARLSASAEIVGNIYQQLQMYNNDTDSYGTQAAISQRF